MRPLAIFTAGLLSLGILLSGCGRSDSDAAFTISKATFVREANEICKRTHEAYLAKGFAALAKVEKEMPNAAAIDRELAVTTQIFLPTYRAQLQEIRELGTPQGDAKTINAYLTSFEKTLDKWEEDPREFREDQANFGNPYKRPFAIAERYGIRPCGQP